MRPRDGWERELLFIGAVSGQCPNAAVLIISGTGVVLSTGFGRNEAT